MVGWHHQFNGHRLGQTLGDGEGQEAWSPKGSQRVGHNLVTEQKFFLMSLAKVSFLSLLSFQRPSSWFH